MPSYQYSDAHELCLRWLYSHLFILKSTAQNEADKTAECSILFPACLFEDMIQNDDTRAALADVITELSKKTRWLPVEEAYCLPKNAQAGSLIRNLIFAFEAKPGALGIDPYRKVIRNFTYVDFFCDLLVMMDRAGKQRRSGRRHTCAKVMSTREGNATYLNTEWACTRQVRNRKVLAHS